MNYLDSLSEETASQNNNSFTDELSSVSSEEMQVELDADFTEIWRHLREVIRVPEPQAKWPDAECPKLTDLVLNSHDLTLRPYTVVLRVYPFCVFEEEEPLPPISPLRKGLATLPSLYTHRV